MTTALESQPPMAANPMSMPPSSMPMAGAGSLVDAAYGGGGAPGAVVPISRNDPDNVAGGRSVTQEVLGTPHRGASVMGAMYASGLPPLAIGRDLRQAGVQGTELIERMLDAPGPFDAQVLAPMRGIAAFDLLSTMVGKRGGGSSRRGGEERSSGDGGSDGSTTAAERLRDDAERVMDKLVEQFPLSENEKKVQEYDHAYRVVGHHEGGKVSGDRDADLFVVDASFTGEMVIDGGNVRRVENRVHFDGPPRWVGPFKPIDSSHRYSFVMKKLDETGRVIAQVRSVHNHELEGSGLVGTQHITLFEVPQTGLNIQEVLGVVSMVVGLIPGGQLPAAILSFASAGIRVIDGGKIGIGDLIGLVVSGLSVAGAVAGATGNLALAADLSLAKKIVVGAGGVVQGIESGDWKRAVSSVVALGVSTNVISQNVGQFLNGGLAAYQAAEQGDYGQALTTLFGAAVQSKLLPREASLIVSGGVMAVHAFLQGDYAAAALAVINTARDTQLLSKDLALVLSGGVAAVTAFVKGDYIGAASVLISSAAAGKVISEDVALVLGGGVAAVSAFLQGDYVGAANALIGAGVQGGLLSREAGLLLKGGTAAVAAFLQGDYPSALNLLVAAGAQGGLISRETALVISGGVSAVGAFLKGDYVAAANFIVGAGVAAKVLSRETGFLIAGGAGAVAAFLKGDYAGAADQILGAGVASHLISWEAGMILSGGAHAVVALLNGQYAEAANHILGAAVAAKLISREAGLVISGGVGAVNEILKGNYAAAANFIIGGAVAGKLISPEIGLLLVGGVEGVSALLRGDYEGAASAIVAIGVAGKVLSPEVALVVRGGIAAIKAFLAGDLLGAANAVLAAAASGAWFPESDLRLMRRGLDAVVALLQGNYQPALELGGELLTPQLPSGPADAPLDLDAIKKQPKPDPVFKDPLDDITKQPKPDPVFKDPLDEITKQPKPDPVVKDPLDDITKQPKPDPVFKDPLDDITKQPKPDPVVKDPLDDITKDLEVSPSEVIDDRVVTVGTLPRPRNNVVRARQLAADFLNASLLSKNYFSDEIVRLFPDDMEDVRNGLVLVMGGAAAVVGVAAGIGAGIGGVFAGGPGVAVGAQAGAMVGAEVLKWLGVGFLVIETAQAAKELYLFLERVRQADGNPSKVEAAALQLAKALALILKLVVEALVGYAVQKGVPAALEKLRGSKLLETIGGKVAREWLKRRVQARNAVVAISFNNLVNAAVKGGAPQANALRLRDVVAALGITVNKVATWGTNAFTELSKNTRSIEELEATLPLVKEGRIIGIDDWLAFSAHKKADDALRTAAELREARRLAATYPHNKVNVGGDARAPRNPDGSAVASFDLSVDNAAGAVLRSFEMTTVDAVVTQSSQLSDSVRHAAVKAAKRRAMGQPIQGEIEAIVQIRLGDTVTAKGGALEIANSGDITLVTKTVPPKRIPKGNLFEEFAKNAGKLNDNQLVDAVTVVDKNTGAIIARIERSGAVWSRTR
jgi:hypothetical protein